MVSDKEIMEAVKPTAKHETLSLRTAFIAKHQCWVKLLNQRDKLCELSESVTPWHTLEGQYSHTDKIDFLTMTEPLLRLQKENRLCEKGDGTKTGYTFDNEKELLIACATWMYENLKAISRGEFEYLRDVGLFGRKEANAILSTIKIRIPSWEARKEAIELAYGREYSVPMDYRFQYDYGDDEGDSWLTYLARCVHMFCEYIQQALDGGVKAKFGIYKIGVCAYQKLGQPECGKVFIGWQHNSEACEDHAKKWHALKHKRFGREVKKSS